MFENIKTDSLDNIALACAQFNNALTSDDAQIQKVKAALTTLQKTIPDLGETTKAMGAGDTLSQTIANLEYVVYGLDIQSNTEQDAKILIEILKQVKSILMLILTKPEKYLPFMVRTALSTEKGQSAFGKNIKRIELLEEVLSKRIELTSRLKSDEAFDIEACADLCKLISDQEELYKKKSGRDNDTAAYLIHVNQIYALIVKPLIAHVIKHHYPEHHPLAHSVQTYIELINPTHKNLLTTAKKYCQDDAYKTMVKSIDLYEKWFATIGLPLDEKQHILMPDLSQKTAVINQVKPEDDDIDIDMSKFIPYDSDDESSSVPVEIRPEKDELLEDWNKQLAELEGTGESSVQTVPQLETTSSTHPRAKRREIESTFGSFADHNVDFTARKRVELGDDVLDLIHRSVHHDLPATKIESPLPAVIVTTSDDTKKADSSNAVSSSPSTALVTVDGSAPEYPRFTAKQIALAVLCVGVVGLIIAAASTGIGAFFVLGSLAALFTTAPGIAMLGVVAAPVLTYFGVKYKRGENLIESSSSLPKLLTSDNSKSKDAS